MTPRKPARRSEREKLTRMVETIRNTHWAIKSSFIDNDGAAHEFIACQALHGISNEAWPCELRRLADLVARVILGPAKAERGRKK